MSKDHVHFEEALERIYKATGTSTQVQLAEVLDIRQSSISDAKRRKSVPADWLLKLYENQGLNPSWIKQGSEPMFLDDDKAKAFEATPDQPRMLFNLGFRSRDEAALNRIKRVPVSTWSGKAHDKRKWIPNKHTNISLPDFLYRQNLVVVRVDGESMTPTLRKGAFIGVDESEHDIKTGEIFAMHLENEGLVLRRMYHNADQGVYELRADNPDFPSFTVPSPNIQQYIVGQVIWVIQEL